MLGSHGELGNRSGLARLVGAAGLNENRATAGGAATVIDDRQNFFLGEELVQVFYELPALRDLGHTKGRTLAGNLIFTDLGQVVVAETLEGSFGDGFHFGVGAQDHNQSSKLAA